MNRAAIYARFSSDLQSDRSIEDQVELCRDFARRNGLAIVATFSDRARSGASILGRDGLLSLMEQSRAGAFDVVVTEALDRLSRDQEDLAGIYKRLSFANIKIQAVHDGIADQMQIGIRGLVGALYLQDLSHKVRRGLAGVTRDGRHAGGRAYGYRTVAGSPGELVIDELEAEVLRRIFREFVAGETARAIVARLNKDGIRPPRGTYWQASALSGNKKRGYGILLNEIYTGTLVWNRVRMIKDPSTGRRVSRVNPAAEWQRAAAPQLTIIDAETFAEAQRMLRDRAQIHSSLKRRPKHLLSGLLRCGCCGAGMSVKDTAAGRVRVHCTGAREGAVCTNRKAFYLDKIESAVLGGLEALLADPRAVAEYVAVYNQHRMTLIRDAGNREGVTGARLEQLGAELNRIIGMTVKGLISEEEAAKLLPPLREEKAALEGELEELAQSATVIQLHPRMAEAYSASIARLREALSDDDHETSRAAVRQLINTVTVTPTADGPAVRLDGWLSALSVDPRLGGAMVAGERYRATPQDVRVPFSLAL